MAPIRKMVGGLFLPKLLVHCLNWADTVAMLFLLLIDRREGIRPHRIFPESKFQTELVEVAVLCVSIATQAAVVSN